MENFDCWFKLTKYCNVARAINGLSVFVMCIGSYVIDKEQIIVPHTTLALIISLLTVLFGGILPYKKDAERYESLKADSGNFIRVESSEKKENSRKRKLGNSLDLREDLYSWSYVGCFERVYLL